LLNKLPENEEQARMNMYLLHVATSRAIDEMYICCYSDKGNINPWFSLVDTSSFKNIGKINYSIPTVKYDKTKKGLTTSITEILSDISPKHLNLIHDYIKLEVVEEKIFSDYSNIDRKEDDI